MIALSDRYRYSQRLAEAGDTRFLDRLVALFADADVAAARWDVAAALAIKEQIKEVEAEARDRWNDLASDPLD